LQDWPQYVSHHDIFSAATDQHPLVILGATNPLASNPGTIRGDYAIDVGRNVCHGSDGVESAKKEIALWFKDDEVISYKQNQFDWIYEKP
jgi:nucleoside-diphosphate kinase